MTKLIDELVDEGEAGGAADDGPDDEGAADDGPAEVGSAGDDRG
jgi:hypothetical protein